MSAWEQARLLALAQLLTSLGEGEMGPLLKTTANLFVLVPSVFPLSAGDESCKPIYTSAVED